MMRNRIFISLLAALSLAACIKDDFKPEYCAEQPIYLSFVLKGGGQKLPQAETKATTTYDGSFSAQEVAEQLVVRVDMYFYASDGSYLGKRTQTSFSQQYDGSDQNVSNVVGKFAVKLNFKPSRMLVTVNSGAANVDLSDCSLTDALDKLQESTEYSIEAGVNVKYVDKGTGSDAIEMNVNPFYMSSSTYVKGSYRVCDVEIPASYIYDTEKEALSGSSVEVHLERLAAKVTLKVPKEEFMVPVVTSQDSLTAKVKLLGWNLNTLNRKTFYFKNVVPSWSYTWQGIEWNNTAKFRSYWAKDNNYSGENNSIKLEQQAISPQPGEEYRYRKPGELDLQLVKNTDSSSPDYGKYVGVSYCLENTSDTGILPVTDSDVSTLYSRATHILIKAKLSFAFDKYESDPSYNYKDEDEFKGAQNFFRYKGMFFTKKGLLKALRQDTDLNPTIPDSDIELVTAKEAKEIDPTYCNGYDLGEVVAVKTGSTYPKLKDTNNNPVRIDGFRDGEFYYKIPIEHINNDNPSSTDVYYPIAKYGVVRNHNYEITIGEDLKGIGTGIWDKTLDIRPFRKTDDYRVTAYVRVSPWKQFETRFLFIDPSGLLVTDGQKVIMWEDEGDPNKDGEGDNVWTGNGWYF